MKKILALLVLCLLVSGCALTYKESVHYQLDRYGYEADSTRLVIETDGGPSCVDTYDDNPEYDMIVTYQEHDVMPYDINVFPARYWVRSYFNEGSFVKKDSSALITIRDIWCSI